MVRGNLLMIKDCRFLYFSNWLHGDVRQYDITDTRSLIYLPSPKLSTVNPFKSTKSNIASMLRNPKLTGQIFFGGLIQAGGPVKVIEDKEMSVQPQVSLIQEEKVIANSSESISKRTPRYGHSLN